MGYSTQYNIDAGPFESAEAAEFFEFKVSKEIDEAFEVDIQQSHGYKHTGKYYVDLKSEDTKWYEWRADLTKVSTLFPDVTIDVEGKGEETGDIWKARFRNGDCEVVDAEFMFPPFRILVD